MTDTDEPPEMALHQLARFIAESEFYPDATTVEVVRDALIDTVGCMLIGARQPVAQQTLAAIASWGDGQAPVLGTDLNLSPPWAAMANAVAAHAIEFDDWEIPGNTHPSIVIFPSLLALAAEKPYSGKDILDAYLVGFEVIARLGEAMNFEHYDAGWHSTATLGPIGSAAAVARLQGLNCEQTAHAMALSISQAVGYTSQFGSTAKPLQAGFAAKTGIIAATLAEHGLTGQAKVLDGPRSFNALMGPGDSNRFSKVMTRLGGVLALTEYGLVVKPYPSCGYTHRVIDCALELRKKLAIDPSHIVKITASLPDFHAAILPFHQPTKRAEALFSFPFCVAQTLIHGNLTLADLEAERWNEPIIRDLISRTERLIRKPINPKLNYDPDDPDWVEIEMTDGSVHRAEVIYPLGAPQNRMTPEQIMDKFFINAGIEATETVQQTPAITALKQWHTTPDIHSVIRQLGDLV